MTVWMPFVAATDMLLSAAPPPAATRPAVVRGGDARHVQARAFGRGTFSTFCARGVGGSSIERTSAHA